MQIQAGNPVFAAELLSGIIQQGMANAATYYAMAIAALHMKEGEVSAQAAKEACRLAPREPAYQYMLGRAMMAANRPHDAIQAYRKAIQMGPGNADYYVSLAISLRAAKKLDKAVTAYRNALKIQPGMVEAAHNLANLQVEIGDVGAAEAGYRQVLAQRPNYAPSHFELGNIAHSRGDTVEAERCYRAAVESQPKYAKAWYALGNLKYAEKAYEEAAHCLTQALSVNPSDAKTLLLQGRVLARNRREAPAIEMLQNCLAIEPDNVDALTELGGLLRKTGQHAASIACLERAVDLSNDTVQGHARFMLAETLMEVDGYLPAAAQLEEVLVQLPEDAQARLMLATAYRMLGRMKDADAHAEVLARQHPDSVITHAIRATIASDCGDIESAAASFCRAAFAAPDIPGELGKFCMSLNYLAEADRDDIYIAHREFGERFMLGLRSVQGHTSAPAPERRLRIGYVSADFRNHSVAWFMRQVLSGHDRAHFEIHGYYVHARTDEVTEELHGLCDGWMHASGIDDEQLAERIRSDGIDILVDLAGHTAGNRLGVFARKPAPVQMTWLGYLSTTGVSAIDYRITDAQVDPDGYEAWQVERPLRLPGCYVCYGPPADAPEVGPLPALGQGCITFGSFNNLAKFSRATLALWARILQAVPGSRLLLKSKALADAWIRDRLIARFAELGIGAERLELIGRQAERASHLELYNRIDIGLDTYPYNGVTTTCEALWMGVPVLSLTGLTQASRQGLTLLKAVGLEGLSCADEDSLVAKARQLSGDPSGLAALRAGLRERMAASPLVDGPNFTRHLEHAYRQAWRAWCSGRSQD